MSSPATTGGSSADARPRRLDTAHGALRLPAFLPDATRGVVRTLGPDDPAVAGVRLTAAPVVVISTATGSLGGRRHLRHDGLIERTLAASGRRAARFEVAGEAVVVAWQAAACAEPLTSARTRA